MPSTSILVLGAGELGTAILENLHHHAHSKNSKITVLLRNSTIETSSASKRAELNHLKDLGIHFLAGDVAQNTEEELSSLFEPFDTIIGCTGMSAVSGIQVKLSQAVLAAKVSRYIPWQFGVDYDIIGPSSSQDLFSEQLEVRALLRAQTKTSWTIISTGMFTSFLFDEGFGVVSGDKGTVRALGSWDNKVTVTCVEDIGLMNAEVVFGEVKWDRVVFVAGDTISYGQLADVVEKVCGKGVERVENSVDLLKTELEKDPDNGMRKYRVVFAEGKGVAWEMGKTLNAEKGMVLQNVEDWLRKNSL
jgi:hypothetical protein